jgi:hypothetical protein
MDKFIQPFVDVLKPPWNYLVGIVAVLLIVGPRLAELRHTWLELRLGREALEREKLHLEVLKLRIDLRQLAQQHQLPEIAHELETVTVSPPSVVVPSPPSPERQGVLRGFGFIRRFVAGHPRLGRVLVLIARIFLGYFLSLFAIAAVVLPFVGWTDPDGPGLSISLAIVYAAFAWLSWKGFMVTGSMRKEFVARARAAEPPQAAAAATVTRKQAG